MGIVGGYRRELAGQRSRAIRLLPFAFAGCAAGVALLLVGGEGGFEAVVPFLIVGACLLLLFQPALKRRLAAHSAGPDGGGGMLAAVAFAFLAPVDWSAAAVPGPATLVGGFGGANVARRLSDTALRAVVVSFGLGAAVYLLLS